MISPIDRQWRAFEMYRAAKLQADQTMAFHDRLEAARLWTSLRRIIHENTYGPSALSPSEFRRSRPDLDFSDPNQHAAISMAYARHRTGANDNPRRGQKWPRVNV